MSEQLASSPDGADRILAEQGALFDDAEFRPAPEAIGYRGAVVIKAVGITYRQLDYWARTDLVVPSIKSASGSGSHRLYSFRDIIVLRIVKRLLETGVSLPNIRQAVEHLKQRGDHDISQIMLMSDGATVYECRSNDDIIDLVRGGQGVFGIAVATVWREVEATIHNLPAESAENGEYVAPEGTIDELEVRRQRRSG